jgi:hypothetical protein
MQVVLEIGRRPPGEKHSGLTSSPWIMHLK